MQLLFQHPHALHRELHGGITECTGPRIAQINFFLLTGSATSFKPTYVNGAFRVDSLSKAGRGSSKKKKDETHRHFRQISDISAFFRLPLPDEKSLSDLVIEEYDNKTRTLRGGESGRNGFRASTSSSPAESEDEDNLEEEQQTRVLSDVTNTGVSEAQKKTEPCKDVCRAKAGQEMELSG